MVDAGSCVVGPCRGCVRGEGRALQVQHGRAGGHRSSVTHIMNMMTALLLSFGVGAVGLGRPSYIETRCSAGCFTIASKGVVTTIYVDDALESPGVLRAAGDLQADVHSVTAQTPPMAGNNDSLPPDSPTIIVGTLGRSSLLAELIRRGKVDPTPLAGAWEAFVVATVADPLPGLASALVIAGSDKRGTIFGVYDLSEQIGVSPWHWWADVPATREGSLFVKPGTHVQQVLYSNFDVIWDRYHL